MALPALTLSFAAQEFDVGAERIGIVLTAYIVGMAAVSVPSGIIGDRIGPSKVLAAFFWVLGLGAVACSFAQDFWQLLAAHALLGVGAGLFHPAALGLVSLSVEPAKLGRAMGAFGLVGGLGWFSVPILMRLPMGWRAGFLVIAGASVLGAIVCHVLMSRGALLGGPAPPAPARSTDRRGSAGRLLLVGLLIAMGSNAFLLDGFLPMFPEVVSGLGTWVVQEQMLVASIMAIGAVGQYVGGILARDVFASSRFAVLLVIQPLTLLSLAHSLDEPAWPFMLMGSFAFMNFMTQPIENKLLATFTSARRRSTAYALKFVVALLIAAPAPMLVSGLYSAEGWSFEAIFRLLALTGMVGVFAGYVFLKQSRGVARA